MSTSEKPWTTPIPPMQPGSLWCCRESRGHYEWFCAPETARDLIKRGIVIDGERCRVRKLGEFPGIGAWQIGATKPSAVTSDDWIPPSLT